MSEKKPKAPKPPKPAITVEVLAVLQEWNGKQKVHLRVVRWIIDGVASTPKLEKRSFFRKKDGSFSEMGSLKGFGKSDIEFVLQNWSEVQMFF